MHLTWLTDLHLNFVSDEHRQTVLVDEINATGADAILIGGDTGEADSFATYLEQLAGAVRRPVYFVLGNHDYYHGSVARVREEAHRSSRRSEFLSWLPSAGIVPLTQRTALLGHGGWGDGRAGDFEHSDVLLNDYFLIDELREAHGFPESEVVLTPALRARLMALGDEAAAHFADLLPDALRDFESVLVLMHVPPYHAACWHEGQLSDDNWAPHFVCQAVGETLTEIMLRHPDRRMTVLCGHTHSGGHARILDNLEVHTGAARYRHPGVERVLEVA